ncbi:hypothetical protein Ga0609869_001271 [Rhodovulum iodosum]|uniref:Lytic transglycosylase domain-containing protein n=1 Tax=Rhodovulum iodosum TaxID=68291 RepID=A0ABV3XUA0_9RHOB|nr:lytic transglycosylase domain-containing protein [Rhodovulum robiginosum]RSK40030.1 lytic transglycosylase domain-containing protein [Rhodovulum robiginosum]
MARPPAICPGRLCAALLVLWLGPVAAAASGGAADPSTMCERAAQAAARATGVPLPVLRAISLTETGRKRGGRLRPWPWTVNMEGKGQWFDDPAAAQAFVDRHFRRGARSFDVGCFQLNYKWHHRGFDSVAQMFEPEASALYAARFLSELFRETGDWSKAAGAYHSRTPKFASRYRKRFDRLLAGLGPPPTTARGTTAPAPVGPRVNRYPLLTGGAGPRAPGSLVPLGGAVAVPLFTRAVAGG